MKKNFDRDNFVREISIGMAILFFVAVVLIVNLNEQPFDILVWSTSFACFLVIVSVFIFHAQFNWKFKKDYDLESTDAEKQLPLFELKSLKMPWYCKPGIAFSTIAAIIATSSSYYQLSVFNAQEELDEIKSQVDAAKDEKFSAKIEAINAREEVGKVRGEVEKARGEATEAETRANQAETRESKAVKNAKKASEDLEAQIKELRILQISTIFNYPGDTKETKHLFKEYLKEVNTEKSQEKLKQKITKNHNQLFTDCLFKEESVNEFLKLFEDITEPDYLGKQWTEFSRGISQVDSNKLVYPLFPDDIKRYYLLYSILEEGQKKKTISNILDVIKPKYENKDINNLVATGFDIQALLYLIHSDNSPALYELTKSFYETLGQKIYKLCEQHYGNIEDTRSVGPERLWLMLKYVPSNPKLCNEFMKGFFKNGSIINFQNNAYQNSYGLQIIRFIEYLDNWKEGSDFPEFKSAATFMTDPDYKKNIEVYKKYEEFNKEAFENTKYYQSNLVKVI